MLARLMAADFLYCVLYGIYIYINVSKYTIFYGSRGSVVVEAPCYKPEVAGSRPDEVNEFLQFA
jgi:hypothetical protein